jgi:hypothetical protein
MRPKATAVSLVCALLAAPAVLANPPLARGHTLQAVVGPHDSSMHPLVVSAGATVTIRVIGNGASDLDLFVYDEFDTLLAADTDITGQCAITTALERPGVVRIVVRNGGGNENAYTLEVT